MNLPYTFTRNIVVTSGPGLLAATWVFYIRTQSLILHQMLTFEGGLNLRKIEAVGSVAVTLHQPKRKVK